jgi:hypothetical protein
MARERMVTRTVVSQELTIMTVNMESKTVENITVSLPSGDTLTEKAREKAIKAMLPENNTFVQVISSELKETLYGMTEQEFIRIAKVLPPRTKAEPEV